MPKSHLYRHLTYLLYHDPNFCSFWAGLEGRFRWRYLEQFERIDSIRRDHADQLIPLHDRYVEHVQDMFKDIQQIPMNFTQIDPEYLMFVRSLAAKYKAMREMANNLTRFCEVSGYADKTYWYGRIKPDLSLFGKLKRLGRSQADTSPERLLHDAVRFRFLTPDVATLHQVCLSMCNYFAPRLLACRNYMVVPKFGAGTISYKAIHLILSTEHRILPVELQLMTENREAASIVDHLVVFKGVNGPISVAHKRWLSEFVMAANVADAMSLNPSKGEQ
jgi:hypothetical protein